MPSDDSIAPTRKPTTTPAISQPPINSVQPAPTPSSVSYSNAPLSPLLQTPSYASKEQYTHSSPISPLGSSNNAMNKPFPRPQQNLKRNHLMLSSTQDNDGTAKMEQNKRQKVDPPSTAPIGLPSPSLPPQICHSRSGGL